MYTQFFGLREKPFAITPDPRYLYLSQRHADALAHLIYGISHSGGFIQLTGEVGTGKTTLVRTLFEQLPDEADVALILNPELSVPEFLAAILDELKVPQPTDRSAKILIDRLNAYLLVAHARGRRTVLIVDEAQNLGPNILEQVRLLTNLETPKQKLLQIILIGQPELRELLAREDMRQLAQRVTGRYHLEPLDLSDTGKYLEHRLKVAGAGGGLFTTKAVREIFRQSQGIPRLINVIADRALLAAYTQDVRNIDAPLVRRAATEVFGRERRIGWRAHLAALATVAGLAGIGYATIYHTTPRLPPPAPIEQATLEAADTADDAVSFPVDAVAEAAIAPDGNAVAAEPAALPAEDTAVPASEPVAAPHPTMADLLADPGVPKDTDSAFASLFSLWGADYKSGTGSACGQAQQQGLRCWYQKGTLSHLRRLNRPAILSLLDANGDEYQVVLSGLDADSATLLAGGIRYKIGLEELAEFWFGDQLILWKPGYDGPSSVGPGDEGAGVLWLRASFAKLDGEAPPLNASRYYDSTLEARVRAYQRDNRLGVDGIVGIQTQVVINTDLGVPGTPLLTGDR